MSDSNIIALIGNSNNCRKVRDLFSMSCFNIIQSDTHFTSEMSDAALILEMLEADLETKKQVLKKCAQNTSTMTILAIAVSGVVTEIGVATTKPERVIGLNFIFNPFETKTLVQIARGMDTSSSTIVTVKSLLEKTGATVVSIKDVPGLVIDRTMASVVNEAAMMVNTNTASKEDIDKVTRLCLNWPMGPFEFADYLGIDYVVSILEEASKDSPKYLPCRMLREMVSAGKVGRKSGRGFYEYK